MPVFIISKKNGFRRCGIPHSDKWTEYPDDKFSEAELKRLQKDPMLVVQVLSKKDAEKFGQGKFTTIDDFKDEITSKIKEAVEDAIKVERTRIIEDYQEAYGKKAEDKLKKVILGK